MFVKAEGTSVLTYPYTPEMIMLDWPNVSFPMNLDGVDLSEFNVYPVELTQPPSVGNTEMVQETAPQLKSGKWVQSWEVSEAPQDLAEEWRQNAWIRLREERNGLLSNSDWTQLADSPVDNLTWAKYRQELRDLPSQTPDPFNPVWPIPPT